jgi:hypothetical protein
VSQAAASGACLCGCSGSELPPERVRLDVVRGHALPVELDDRDQLAVPPFQVGVTVDLDLLELETELVAQSRERRTRPLAEVTAGSVVEDDARHRGYG